MLTGDAVLAAVCLDDSVADSLAHVRSASPGDVTSSGHIPLALRSECRVDRYRKNQGGVVKDLFCSANSKMVRWLTLGCCLAITGCFDPPPQKSNGTGPSPSTGNAKAETTPSLAAEKPAVSNDDKPPLSDWKTPAAAFLLTGEQHGYFEPCGCSLHQLGGMARRADLVRMLAKERKWPLSGFDIGGTLKRSRRQDQIKFLLVFDALKYMNYAAVALGVEELKLGADFLLQQQIADPEELKKSVALLSANVVLFDQPDLGWPVAWRMVQVGDVKVGVTAVIGASLRDQVAPVGNNFNITIKNPTEVLPGVIEKMEAEKPAFMVLLSHGSQAEAKELAEKYPQFKIILTAGGPEEPEAKPTIVGKTWILEAGHKGKRVGVLGYYPDDAKNPFRFDLVELDDTRFKNDEHMRTLMKNYQQQLQDESLATSDELLLRHPSGNTFVGVDKCAKCHEEAYNVWKTSKHADGLESLKVGHPGDKDWIVRIHDPECLSCHVTGWEPQQMLRFESGYITEEKSPHLVGQQCENCHGPGSKHTALEEALTAKAADLKMDDVTAARASVSRTLEQARTELCIQCHDSDNSPKFKPDAFMEYWEKVRH